MDGAFGELVAGMVDADVAIAEVDQAVVAAPAIGVDDGARVDPAADDAEVSHQPTRQRERQSAGHLQRFASVGASVIQVLVKRA